MGSTVESWHPENPRGYRHPPHIVHALCDVLMHYMDDETWEAAGGYVLRDDPRNLAQAVLDHLGGDKAQETLARVRGLCDDLRNGEMPRAIPPGFLAAEHLARFIDSEMASA